MKQEKPKYIIGDIVLYHSDHKKCQGIVVGNVDEKYYIEIIGKNQFGEFKGTCIIVITDYNIICKLK